MDKQQIPAGYKQTEVGVIPEDWEIAFMGDLAGFQGGYAFKSSNFKSEGIYQVVKMTNVYGGALKLNRSASFLDLLAGNEMNYLLKQDDILITLTGTVGKEDYGYTCRIKDEKNLLLNQRVARITSKGKFNSTLLEYETKHKRFGKQFFDRSKGGTGNQSNVSTSDLVSILIPVPKFEEQTAIANALSDVDALIAALEKLIDKKTAIKTATMQQLLTGKKRLPPFDQLDVGYKQTELGEIPRDWEVAEMSFLCDVRDGTHDSPKYKDNGIPLVTSKNIVNDVLDLSDVSLISKFDAVEINKRSKVDKGDIIMSMIGTIGSAVLLHDEPNFCIKNVALFKPKKIEGTFLIQLIKSAIFQSYLGDSLDGGIQKFVSLSSLRGLRIARPKQEEQTAIANVLSDMDTELDALQQRLAKTQHIKQGMMQELLTGKTRLI